MRLKNSLLYGLFLVGADLFAQSCPTGFSLSPVQTNNRIEWDKFPEFSLPFSIVYNGPRFNDDQARPLRHGFSHLASFSGNEGSTLPPEKRALLWLSVGSINDANEPWAIKGLESPWGNDTARYRREWDGYLSALANMFEDSRGTTLPKAGIICLDIERMQREDRDILRLKEDPRIPAEYRALPDPLFLAQYKKDIRWWYTEAVRHLRAKNLPSYTKLSSYSDVPIRNTWLNVTANSWQDWTTNLQRTHYLMQDDEGKIPGEFYKKLDLLTPSPYYYYPYSNPLGKDYLTYLLFQIEANDAWGSKPQLPFVWLRYHDSFTPSAPMVPNFVAEATAIFPFFAGAKGLWLWENPFFENNRQENYAPYEHFIYGLYRLSEHKAMFEGEYELVKESSARDLMASKQPVWRGVVKGDRILIAAQNTYADENQETVLLVRYKQWARRITLKGREVFLCAFDLNDTITGLPSYTEKVQIYPNPVAEELRVSLDHAPRQLLRIELLDLNGKILRTYQPPLRTFGQVVNLRLPTLVAGTYLVRVQLDEEQTTTRIIVQQ